MKLKRFLSLVLAVVMLLSMISCSSSLETGDGETKEETKTAATTEKNEKRDPTGFAAGFARTVISPTFPTGMGGYGNTDARRSSTIAEDIYASCVAISDGETKALFFSIDVLSVSKTNCDNIYRRVEKELGIPSELVTISTTHNHAGPNVSSSAASVANYMSVFYSAVMKVAKEAVADLDRCEMKIGRAETENLSYVRRYFREDGTFAGTNYFAKSDAPIVRHETEVDNEMQFLMLDRVNGKDILMVNWQCHATTAGKPDSTVISSDWVGAMRDETEKNADVYLSFHQGAAGNVVPNSMITTEPSNANYTKHGKDLAAVIVSALGTLKPVESGKIRAVTKDVTCTYEKEFAGYDIDKALEIQKFYKNGERETAQQLARQYGFDSMYHANSIADGAKRTATSVDMNLSAVAIGDIGFAVAPYEMFDTNGMEIKDGSDFTMTFICAYTGNYGYIPSRLAWPNGGYEVGTCPYVCGTGEMLAGELVSMLGQLK